MRFNVLSVRERMGVGVGFLALVMGLGYAFAGSQPTTQDTIGTTVTESHRRLLREVGTWKVVSKTYVAGPENDPVISEGREVVRAMGPFWVIADFQADFGGVAFQGHSQLGYDTVKKCYVGTWIDTMSTQIMALQGSYDEQTRKLTMVGEGLDPITQQLETMKLVTHYLDDDHRQFTMFEANSDNPGSFVQTMVMDYSRIKASD